MRTDGECECFPGTVASSDGYCMPISLPSCDNNDIISADGMSCVPCPVELIPNADRSACLRRPHPYCGMFSKLSNDGFECEDCEEG